MVQSFFRIVVPKGIRIFLCLNFRSVVYLFSGNNLCITVRTTNCLLGYFSVGTLQQTYVLRLVAS